MDGMRKYLDRIEQALTIPAVEYVPAIGDVFTIIDEARRALDAAAAAPARLWLWKNFVGGRPEYWAFDNAFPINLENGDPQTLGEPCGYAIVKPSRQGRTDVSEEEVLRRIAVVTGGMTLADRIGELIEQHGSLRAAARVLDCDAGYLSRLQSGEKDAPEDWLLRRMKLRRLVTYERTDGVPEVEAPSGGVVWTPEDEARLDAAIAKRAAARGVPAHSQSVTVETLRQHWLRVMECDHATGRDKPHCACSCVDLGWHPSVGAAVEAWLAHVSGVMGTQGDKP